MHELGVGRVPVERGRLPSIEEMEALFRHESTRFIGGSDRDAVSKGYLDLRRKMAAYDAPKIMKLLLQIVLRDCGRRS